MDDFLEISDFFIILEDLLSPFLVFIYIDFATSLWN